MKTLYLIGGTMGIGKTTVSQILKMRLPNAVFLDGDWCWDASPFQVTAETRSMVIENICFLLNNFIKCPAYDNVIFCWVMHQQSIIDDILSRLDVSACNVVSISLTATAEAITSHLEKDVANGIRTADVIERSISRIKLYDELDTIKIDVTELTPNETADKIMAL